MVFDYNRIAYDLDTGDVQQYFIDPVGVAVTITDVNGHTSTVNRQVTFADDGFRPTPDQPTAECAGTVAVATSVDEDDAAAPVLAAPVKLVTATPGVFTAQIACDVIADCNTVAKVYSPRRQLLARGRTLVRAGQTVDMPLSLTRRGKHFTGKRVRLRVGFADAG